MYIEKIHLMRTVETLAVVDRMGGFSDLVLKWRGKPSFVL